MPDATTYTDFRKNLSSYMKKLKDDATVLTVTNERNPEYNMVAMNASEYDSIMETLYIYSQPGLHKQILDGLEDYRNGRTKTHRLLEP